MAYPIEAGETREDINRRVMENAPVKVPLMFADINEYHNALASYYNISLDMLRLHSSSLESWEEFLSHVQVNPEAGVIPKPFPEVPIVVNVTPSI